MGKIWSTTLIALALSGCVTVKVAAPILPPPEWPTVTWEACAPQRVCLSEADGNKVNRFIDQLSAYQHALARLLEDRKLVTP